MTVDVGAFDAFERRAWERNAAAYRDRFAAVTGAVVDRLLEAAGVTAGVRLLDVGTGPGLAAARAVARGADVVGVDASAAMVEIARAAVPGAAFRQGDATALPLPDSVVDAVTGNFVILHVGRPDRAAAEFARVLRPGGTVALTTWDLPGRCRLLGVVLDAVAAAQARPVPGLPDGPPFFRFADDAEFADLLASAGLVDVQVETVEFVHHVAPDEWWGAILAATARTGPLVSGQDTDTQRRIRAAYDEQVAPYVTGGVAALPASVKLVSGRRTN